jgi:uncharacterized protein YqeY
MSRAAQALAARLRADLKAAMRARDALETGVLRELLAALDNAQAVPVDLSGRASAMQPFAAGTAEAPRRTLSAADVARLVAAEAAGRAEAAAQFGALGHAAEAARLAREAPIVRRYG